MNTDFKTISNNDKKKLFQAARFSIEYGLTNDEPPHIENSPGLLGENAATFVTLKKEGELRGCMGILEAVRPLVDDVAENAYASAFRDPRFPPVVENELENLEISISILTPSTPMTFKSEKDLIDQIQPNIDGLILIEDFHRGTFLPSVWENVPQAKEFIRHLKAKAGLPMSYWSDTIRIERYHTIEFSENDF